MTKNYQNSLFTELTDAESATVNGGSVINGISGTNSNINSNININGNSQDLNMLFFIPQPGQLYMYDPIRQRPYKTLVV